jgi:hypothetical protein
MRISKLVSITDYSMKICTPDQRNCILREMRRITCAWESAISKSHLASTLSYMLSLDSSPSYTHAYSSKHTYICREILDNLKRRSTCFTSKNIFHQLIKWLKRKANMEGYISASDLYIHKASCQARLMMRRWCTYTLREAGRPMAPKRIQPWRRAWGYGKGLGHKKSVFLLDSIIRWGLT